MVVKAQEIFNTIDIEKKDFLTKDQTRLAYFNALGNVDVDDDEFEYEFCKVRIP